MVRGKASILRLGATAAVFVLSTSACGLFTVKEPYERWNIRLSYTEEGSRVVASPDRFEVHGPRGEILVHNSTQVKRGFKIEGLGVAEEIEDDESARIAVTGVQDEETYTFLDHLNPAGPRGTIVVDYIRRD
jgi:hypothetical protein